MRTTLFVVALAAETHLRSLEKDGDLLRQESVDAEGGIGKHAHHSSFEERFHAMHRHEYAKHQMSKAPSYITSLVDGASSAGGRVGFRHPHSHRSSFGEIPHFHPHPFTWKHSNPAHFERESFHPHEFNFEGFHPHPHVRADHDTDDLFHSIPHGKHKMEDDDDDMFMGHRFDDFRFGHPENSHVNEPGPENAKCPGAVTDLFPWPKGVNTGPCVEATTDKKTGSPVTLQDESPTKVDLVTKALERYGKLLPAVPQGVVQELSVIVKDPSVESPGPKMNESYTLHMRAPKATLTAETAFGAIRGLETFSQLLKAKQFAEVNVTDEPRFAHRGVLIDSARHFFPVDFVLGFLDEMSWNKLNVLHWHLTDSQGYTLRTPVAIKHHLVNPKNMSTYSVQDLERIVSYAKDRGIRVIPEIDSPAHVESWIAGVKKEVIDCGYNSVLDPVSDTVPKLMDEVIGELSTIFTDPEFHIGMDEVNTQCLVHSPEVMAYVDKHRQSESSGQALKHAVADYLGKVANIASKHGKTPIVWQEAFDMYGPMMWEDFESAEYKPPEQLPKDAIVQVWKGWDGVAHVHDVAQHGFRTLKSSQWYLDVGEERDVDRNWIEMYLADPDQHTYDPKVQTHIEGGEGALWSEHITVKNFNARAWPRLSAIAERLWSPREVRNTQTAYPRLISMSCTMYDRGVRGMTELHSKQCASTSPHLPTL
jgi:hexosaminidase